MSAVLCEPHGQPALLCIECTPTELTTDPLDAPDTLAKLALIPVLANLVTDTPHREPCRTKPGKLSASPMPNGVRAADLLGDVVRLVGEAVRVTREDMTRAQYDEYPDLDADPSIPADCAWLDATEPVWNADPLTREWVTSNTNQAHRMLALWVNELPQRPPHYTCRKCGGRLHRDRFADVQGQQLGCADCGAIYHPADVVHMADMATPATLDDIAAMLDLPRSTLFRWASAGLLTAVTDHAPSPKYPALFLPSDVARVKGMVRVA